MTNAPEGPASWPYVHVARPEVEFYRFARELCIPSTPATASRFVPLNAAKIFDALYFRMLKLSATIGSDMRRPVFNMRQRLSFRVTRF
jgi:hypothetical protein